MTMGRRTALRWAVALLVSGSSSVVAVGSAYGQGSRPAAPPSVQHGIDTYFTYGCESLAKVKRMAQTEVAEFKALGANSIGIGFPLFTVSMSSNSVFAWTTCKGGTVRTPPAWILGVVIQIAHAAGLKVLLRPLIDQENLQQQNPRNWRGELRPTNLSLWFSSYLRTLTPYLRIAQSEKVEYFSVETELDSLADLSNWTALIARCKGLYTGAMEMSYSWDTGVRKVLRPSTTMGIDTYPRLPGDSPTATPEDLLHGWDYLLGHRGSYAVPAIASSTITEIGIAAQDGAYAWSPSGGVSFVGHPYNQQIQANWFTTACAFMNEHKMQGIYYWGAWLARNNGRLPTAPDTVRLTNLQPLGQQAIKKCFTGR